MVVARGFVVVAAVVVVVVVVGADDIACVESTNESKVDHHVMKTNRTRSLYKNHIPEHSGHPSQVLDQVHFSSQAKLLRAHHDLHTGCPSGATNKYIVSTLYGRTRCVYVLPYTHILTRALRTPGTLLWPLALLLPAGRIVYAPKLATCSDCESKFLLQHANAK